MREADVWTNFVPMRKDPEFIVRDRQIRPTLDELITARSSSQIEILTQVFHDGVSAYTQPAWSDGFPQHQG